MSGLTISYTLRVVLKGDCSKEQRRVASRACYTQRLKHDCLTSAVDASIFLSQLKGVETVMLDQVSTIVLSLYRKGVGYER